ncbi:MAG: class I adenylate-forming enzyme family protein [Terracidiphilus sp.]|jgi:acyl-coenzyme A synthetase/AMP-(fatty) acid ligase
MKMLRNNPHSLRGSVIAAGNLTARLMVGDKTSANWGDLAGGRVLDNPLDKWSGRCVVLATSDPFSAAAALIQLDGMARRIVLCPPDVSRDILSFIANCAEADAIVTDRPELGSIESIDPSVEYIVPRHRKHPKESAGLREQMRSQQVETEWILLTSGTTGVPKLVAHTLESLAGAIKLGATRAAPIVWSTFYDIRRYGGLQIFLRAALTGTSLVLRGAEESTADFLVRAGAVGVTHISGTPSQWRHALMSPAASCIAPEYVRLSGEIADQAILNQLRKQYPQARISHAFASTEAGVVFVVNDGCMGFPTDLVRQCTDVELKVEGCTLRVRSNRTAFRYLNKDTRLLKDNEGFVDTGDELELREGRYYFVGRRDGTVNVGGLKVHPEEVEAVLNRHPIVSISLVRTKRNRITGALVVADVVLRTGPQISGRNTDALQSDILQFCRGELARHKVPVAINFVPALAVAESGKLVRSLA